MEAIEHNHLMHPLGMISGDDEMMDSDYDQAVQQDDDYDIEIDGGEVYSNTGDEEMKFDMGEETITYDHDDLMLDEGEYQASMIQEEMIISETQPVNAPYSSIEMSTTQPDTLGDSSTNLPDTQPLSQSSTQDIGADTFILSQHVPGIVVEVPNSPVVTHPVQEVQENPVEIAENTQQESSAEVEQDIVHSSNDQQPGDFDPGYKPTQDIVQSGQIGHNEDTGIEPHANSENTVLELEKLHPIIVQFESNTLALFNSEHYLNFAALDNSQSVYPEVPSMFLLQDASFYTKGFDELFGALREMFGATIGDDAEITMEFEGLELFLHEDNLLSKSISLSDLMDLYIRLSKQDGTERPDPLYAILSTQARFTKRYSELLTAAGEGKGLSQVSTYPVNDQPTTNQVTAPEEQEPSVQENVQNIQEYPPKPPVEDKETSSDVPKTEKLADTQVSESNESEPPTGINEAIQDVTKSETPLQEVEQENDDTNQAITKGGDGDEEELLPAEDEEEGSIDGNLDSTTIPERTLEENTVVENPVRGAVTESTTHANTDAKEAYAEEVVETAHERQQLDEASEPEGEQNLEEGGNFRQEEQEEEYEEEEHEEEHEEEEHEEEEVGAGTEEQVVEEKHQVQAVTETDSVLDREETSTTHSHQPVEVDGPENEISEGAEGSSGEEVPEDEGPVEILAGDGQSAPVIVDTVYNPRGQSFNAEELLDYEEEEETSPFSEISGGIDHTEQEARNTQSGDNSAEEHEQLLVTTEPPNDDDDSFSSATVVGTKDPQSPGSYGTSSHSSVVQIQTTHDVDTEQHHIEVYQYDEEEASADYDNEAQEEEEVENQGSYVIQESFGYQGQAWQADDDGSFLQEDSYYTAVVDQEEYANGQYDDQDPSIVLTHSEENVEGSAGDNYEDDGEEENLGYLEGEGFADEEGYEEYPEPEETTEYVSRGVRSPSGKRHREEENDIIDVQDIKRTRST